MTDRRYKSDRHEALESQYPSEPMSYRINYKPRPGVKVTWWRKVIRKIVSAL